MKADAPPDGGRVARGRVLRGARLIGRGDHHKVDLLVEGERITAVGSAGSLSAATVEEIDGLWMMPGVIDAHVHPIHNETFDSVGLAAPYGGVTTILHHLYPEPDESVAEAVARGTQGSQRAPTDVGFHIRLTPSRIEEHLAEIPHPGVLSAKLFLAHGDPAVMSSLGDLYVAARIAVTKGMPLIIHAELGDIVNRAREAVGPPHDLVGLDAQRPATLEAAAVHAVGAIGVLTGAYLYLAHLSSALALAAVREARALGARLTVETCPHYLFLTNRHPLGAFGKVAPPLRAGQDVSALRSALAYGDVDVVASDHCGYDPNRKIRSDVATAANGMPGAELLLPLLLDAAIAGEWLTEADLLRVLCVGPARTFGIAAKGRLAPGYDADIVLIDPTQDVTVSRDLLHDRTFYTPYEGRRLRGRVVRVIRRGETIIDHGQVGEAGPAQLVSSLGTGGGLRRGARRRER